MSARGLCGVLAALALVAFWLALTVSGQQAPRIWMVGNVTGGPGGTKLYVVDLSGVCVYVSDGIYSRGVAAVPKTMLPPGAGCQ